MHPCTHSTNTITSTPPFFFSPPPLLRCYAAIYTRTSFTNSPIISKGPQNQPRQQVALQGPKNRHSSQSRPNPSSQHSTSLGCHSQHRGPIPSSWGPPAAQSPELHTRTS